MTHLETGIRELHRGEHRLASLLDALAERHRDDADLRCVGRDLAAWSRRHVADLADAGDHYDLGLDPEPGPDPAALDTEPGRGHDLYTACGDPGLALLGDLRLIHRAAAGVSLDWEVLAQTGKALGNRGLLALTESCHPETVRQLRWTRAALKESAAQIMLAE